MRKLFRWGLAVGIASAAATATSGRSEAGLIAPLGLRQAADEHRLAETVQFTWRGQRYCWYNRGWRGGGWYRCGFNSRRGMGWGGPAGWHGWRRPATARSLDRRNQVGQEFNIRNRSPAGAEDFFACHSPAATRSQSSRSPPCP